MAAFGVVLLVVLGLAAFAVVILVTSQARGQRFARTMGHLVDRQILEGA